MTYTIQLSKDKEIDPLTREKMYSAKNYAYGIASSGFSERDALDRIVRRISEETKDPEIRIFVIPGN